MSQKEVDRALTLSRVKDRHITLLKASEMMNLSYPQSKRLWSKYKKHGPKGLISKKRGKRSNRAVPQEIRSKIAGIIQANYLDCKPLFISEKLEQYHNIKYSPEFIRQVMIEYKLWFPKKKKINIHQRRQRKESEGEMYQGDASQHDWFEGRGPYCHLHIFIDDATSTIGGGYFAPEETTEGYYMALLQILEKKGRPISLYTDKRGTFVINHGKTKGETQFARAMKELDIKMITAHSPQAKGRIERAFGTLQERLVWEMRIQGIQTIEEANKFLPKFFEEYNIKFGEKPANPSNAYRPLKQTEKLKYILCTKEKRTTSKNLEVQYKNKIYQLIVPEKLQKDIRRTKVTVITTLDKEIVFEHHGIQLRYVCYEEKRYEKPKYTTEELLKNWKEDGRTHKKKPPKDHPYKHWKIAA